MAIAVIERDTADKGEVEVVSIRHSWFYLVETRGRLHIRVCSFIRESTCRARKNQPDPFITNALATT